MCYINSYSNIYIFNNEILLVKIYEFFPSPLIIYFTFLIKIPLYIKILFYLRMFSKYYSLLPNSLVVLVSYGIRTFDTFQKMY